MQEGMRREEVDDSGGVYFDCGLPDVPAAHNPYIA